MISIGIIPIILFSANDLPKLPESGTCGHYSVLTCKVKTPPPFQFADFVYGPYENDSIWWQLEAKAGEDDESPLFTLRALTSSKPLTSHPENLKFYRYILSILAKGEVLEYVNINTKSALIPPWKDFEKNFVPHIAFGSHKQDSFPETLEYLGHILTMKYISHDVLWKNWDNAKVLELDPELLVGTGRNFKDAEGHRLPQIPERQNYTYVKFEEEDYRLMIDTGINLFTIAPDQEKWVRDKPVFYLRPVAGGPQLSYPADLYRSNYIGSVMFMDEPAIIMVGDKNIHNTLRYFSDAAATVRKRIRERYYSGGSYSAFLLENQLAQAGVNLGDMKLEQYDFPAWETIFEMAYYELVAEVNGIVHEGRYQLKAFDDAVARLTHVPRKHTPKELLRYHFAFLRGAARSFSKYWGASIYGQCDPEISPLAIKMAYDMGARYIWFWTSDHGHHMPFPEQLELVRKLRQHEVENPRPSITGEQRTIDTAIVIPYGYFISLENLWWVRVLEQEGKNAAYRKYEKLMKNAIKAIHNEMDQGHGFDIIVNDGRDIKGYENVIIIDDK